MNFLPELTAAHGLYAAVSQALQEKESEVAEKKEFAEHLPAEVLEAGVKSGRYVQVQLPVHLRGFSCLCPAAVLMTSLPPPPPSPPPSGHSECQQAPGAQRGVRHRRGFVHQELRC